MKNNLQISKQTSLLKQIIQYSVVFGILVSLGTLSIMSTLNWVFIPLCCLLAVMIFFSIYNYYKKKELTDAIQTQGDAAKDLLNETNIRYNHSLLIQEVGKATSSILNINELIKTIINLMERHLNFDRTVILLTNRKRTKLLHVSDYGYSREQRDFLKQHGLSLEKPETNNMFISVYNNQKPFLLNNIDKSNLHDLRYGSKLQEPPQTKALICVPMMYENFSLGIIIVENSDLKSLLMQSDINLLMGISSQTALGVVNAASYQQLTENEQKYRQLVENANSIILRRDTEGNITFFNEFAQNLFGYAENEILGKQVIGTILPDTESSAQLIGDLEKTLQDNPEQLVIHESENSLRNGDTIWVTWTHKPIFDKDGNLKEILCVGNDISELKAAEFEKHKLTHELRHVQKMEAIGTLAGGIAHDFNNILGAIILNAELANSDEPKNDQITYALDHILKSSKHAKNLVDQISALNRKSNAEQEPLNFNAILKETLEIFKGLLPLTTIISENIPIDTIMIRANATQIEQLIINLCKNGIQAMENNDDRLLSITLNDTDVSSGYVKLSISDNGCGIAQEIRDRIFDPFFTTKPHGKGTGLGLSVVHGIVKDHNGRIEMTSQPGVGTTFHIYLPIIKDKIVDLSPKIKEPFPVGSETILIVEDEDNLRDANQRVLERLGYTTAISEDSADALVKFQADPTRFDLVITDMTMPYMTGDKLAKKLLEIRSDIPIILCSGYSDQINSEKAAKIGIKKFLRKPINLQDFSKSVREVLDQSYN